MCLCFIIKTFTDCESRDPSSTSLLPKNTHRALVECMRKICQHSKVCMSKSVGDVVEKAHVSYVFCTEPGILTVVHLFVEVRKP